ncbi:hypothetical protein [Natrialba swarupiae]|uniref:DUF385 domain-containing protein n=1 Tax=Natrialba swarupiae TaxID=2448032 RepID=A0A5D5AS93_9EURY|nr:hypothetical protein [Natrialba swarupiae]MCW8171939.1 hypothetical protein [Natrialba swarupiae]TYT63715.1 hypothetical protein FYC77_00360 [Natrialba swarupiae]
MATLDAVGSSRRAISSIWRALERRVANPVFRRLLRSRCHWLVSRRLLVLSYVATRSGKRYTFPVSYRSVDGHPTVLTPRSATNWWKNFRDPHECVLHLRGRELPATGEVVGDDERDAITSAYLESSRLIRLVFGSHEIEADRTDDTSPRLVAVRFRLETDVVS